LNEFKGYQYPIDTLSTKPLKGINTLKEKEREIEKEKEIDVDSEGGAGGTSEITPSPPTWRSSFDVYLADETAAYNALRTDEAWIAKRQEYHPGLDILMSLKKSHDDFWGTVAGWENKKATRKLKVIDWKRTFVNALSQRMNQVWKPRAYTAASEVEEERRRRMSEEAMERKMAPSRGGSA